MKIFSYILAFIIAILGSSVQASDLNPLEIKGESLRTAQPYVKLTADFMTAKQLLEYNQGSTFFNQPAGFRDPQGVGLTFLAATEITAPFSGINPPDAMGAIGPTQFIMCNNTGIITFNKSTGIADGVLNTTLETFFSSPSTPFNAIIRYDPPSGVWFINALNFGNPNQVLIAVSSTGTITPATVWTFFKLTQDQIQPAGDTGCEADFDPSGLDANALYIPVIEQCTNSYSLTVFVFQKASLLTSGPAVVTAFRDIYTTTDNDFARRGTFWGVTNFDPSPTYGYLLQVTPSTVNPFNQLQLYRVINPGSATPTLGPAVPITVDPFSIVLNAPHLGATSIDTWLDIGLGPTGLIDPLCLRDRVTTAHIRDNQLWAGQMIAVDITGSSENPAACDRDAIRWYQMDVTGGGTETPSTVPTIIQQANLYDNTSVTNPLFYTFPALMTDASNNLTISGTVCSATQYINAFTTGRLPDDPLNTVRLPVRYITMSNAANNEFPSEYGMRWGDYSYTTVDPVNGSMWTIQEYTAGLNNYGLIVANLTPPPNVEPVSLNACENTPLNGTLTATGGVPPYTFIVTNVVNGTVTLNATTGAFTFTPTPNSIGPASFDYQVTDANGGVSNVATVSITVLSAPTASDGSFSTCSNANLTENILFLVTGGVTPYTFLVVNQPAQGMVSFDPLIPGNFTYVPNGIFSGTDSFTYQVMGANGCLSNVATITITVYQVPVTTSGSVVGACQNTALSPNSTTINLAPLVTLGTPPYTFFIDSGPFNGTLTPPTTSSTGIFIYTPNVGYTGSDSFSYHVVDNNGCVSNSSTISILVNPTPVATNPPLQQVCRNLYISSSLSTPIPYVTGGTPPYTYAVIMQPSNGSLGSSFNSSTGAYTYTPNAGYTGTDFFTYQATDANGCKSNIATVNFNVVVPGLTITKTAGSTCPSSVNAGDNLTYTITIGNTGPCDIQLVSFTDATPAETTFVSFTQNPPAVPAFSLSSPPVGFVGTVSAQINILEVGATASFTLVVNVNSSAADGDTITNTVTANGTTPQVGPISDTCTTSVTRLAELVLTKTAACSPMVVGNEVSFSITLTNNGPSDVDGIVLTDSLPAGANPLFYVFGEFGYPLTVVDPPCLNCPENTGNLLATGSLPAGQSTYFIMQYATTITPVPVLTNTVTVTSTSPVLSLSDSAFVDQVTAAGAGLFVNTSPANQTSVRAGDEITFTILLGNDTGYDIYDFLTQFFIPPGTTVVDIQSRPTAYDDSLGQEPPIASVYSAFSEIPIDGIGRNVVQAIANPFPSGYQNELYITLQVNDDTPTGILDVLSSVTLGQALEPAVVVSTSLTDPNVPLTGLQTIDGVLLVAGDRVLLTAQANGTQNGVWVAQSGTWTRPTDFASGSKAIDVTVLITSGTTNAGTNWLNVSYDAIVDTDPLTFIKINSPLNYCIDIGVVAPQLTVTKFDVPDPVVAGSQLTYTLEISNPGYTYISDVVFTDVLPPYTTFVSAEQILIMPGTPTFTLTTPQVGTNGTITGTLNSGFFDQDATATFTIVVNVDSSAPAVVITNEVTVAGQSPFQSVSFADTTTIIHSSDLEITKSGPASITAGNQLSYTIDIVNNGPSDATNVTLADILPSSTSFVSIDQSGTLFDLVSLPSVSGPGGNFLAQIGTFALNQATTFSLVVDVDKNTTPGTITNSSTISSSDPLVSVTATLPTTVLAPTTTLSITKTSSPNPVTAGSELTYTVTVSNLGPTDAEDVTFIDMLPPEVTLISACQTGTAFNFTCLSEESGGTLEAHTDLFPAGATTVFTIVVLVDANTPEGFITNCATIASAFPAVSLPPMCENTAVIAQAATLTIAKSGIPNPVTAGNILTYTVTVTNTGPNDAQQVTFTDVLPSEVSFVSIAQTGVVFNLVSLPIGEGGTFVAYTDLLPAGQSTTFTLTVLVDEGAPTAPITNTASIQSVFPVALASISIMTQVIQPSLSISKAGTPNPVATGNNLTYTINIVNNSSLAFTDGITITDTLPDQTTFVQVIQVTGPTVTFTTPPVGSSGTVIGTLPTLAGGASIQFVIIVNVLPTTPAGDILTNTAQVVTANPVRNVSATTNTTVSGLSNFSVTKTASATSVDTGDPLVYTINIVNNGPLAAQGITFQDTLPSSLTFVSLSQAGTVTFDTNVAGNVITGTTSQMMVGDSVTFTVNTLVNINAPGGIITNTAAVQSTTPPSAGSGSVQTQIIGAEVDLEITKTGVPNPISAGDVLTYTILVSNGGPDDAQGITFTDTLPAGVVVQSIMQAGTVFDISQSGNTITGTAPTLAANGSTTFTIAVLVPSTTLPGTLTNTATISSVDPTVTESISIATQVVGLSPGLNITKTASPNPVSAGDYITYTVTVLNGGPGDVTDLQFTDELPPEVNFVSIEQTGTPFNLTGIGNTITAFTSDLPLNAFTVFTIVAQVNQNVAGTIENVAIASTATTQVQAIASTTVTPVRDLSIAATCDEVIARAGRQTTLGFSVSNDGLDDVSSVDVAITLDKDVSFVDGVGEGWIFIPTSSGVKVHRDFLGAGQSSDFAITVQLPILLDATLITTATIIESDSPKGAVILRCPVIPQEESCLASALRKKICLEECTQNIEIESMCPSIIAQGKDTPVTFIVANKGSDDVDEVKVVLQLPDGVQIVEIQGCEWVVAVNESTNSCVEFVTPVLRGHESLALRLLLTFTGPDSSHASLNAVVMPSCSKKNAILAPCQLLAQKQSCLARAIKRKYCVD